MSSVASMRDATGSGRVRSPGASCNTWSFTFVSPARQYFPQLERTARPEDRAGDARLCKHPCHCDPVRRQAGKLSQIGGVDHCLCQPLDHRCGCASRSPRPPPAAASHLAASSLDVKMCPGRDTIPYLAASGGQTRSQISSRVSSESP
jgi:hypothetical protein